MSMDELKAQIAIIQSAPAVVAVLAITVAGASFWLAQQLASSTIAAKDGEIKVLQQRLEAYKDNLGADKPEEIRSRLTKLEAQFGADWPELSLAQSDLLVEKLKGISQPDRLTIIYENELALPFVKSLNAAFNKSGLKTIYQFKAPLSNNKSVHWVCA